MIEGAGQVYRFATNVVCWVCPAAPITPCAAPSLQGALIDSLKSKSVVCTKTTVARWAAGFAKALKIEGFVIGRHRMRGLMKSLGLVRRKAQYKHYRRVTKPSSVAPNVLKRRFNPARPNTFWAGDITYIRVGGSWLYLAVVMDLFSRRIVGWAFSRTADTELSLRALRLAVGMRRPSPELVFHSDQGCQYTADRFVAYLREKKIVQSMSRRGNCWDNAVVERYFRSQKHDWSPENGYTNHFEAERDVMDFIAHYNHRRCHTAAKNLPPAIFEKLAA
ncbi:IS3 family transposase [Pseudomonas huanghezhanensis]|uniref:IS3 family transposase n=1 Tax=Pseudomonas huanghezhanensis TaxID=3002903 RepID=UPI00228634E2|nr:IS3 family transposase [Pseudomonas sp. BSw22131]